MRRAWLVLLLVVAAGCGSSPAAAGPFVAYERVGGIAGTRDVVSVSTKGRVVVTQSRGEDRRYRLSAKRLKGLRSAVRAADFPSLERRYAPEYPVSDGYTETVRHGGTSVVVQTGAEPPARLRRLLERLAGLL